MKFLISAGPTRESIDSVRFITNGSTGKMGVAVARAAIKVGHEVLLLAGPGVKSMPDIPRENFVSVEDLQKALQTHFANCDVLVMSAAVGDFTVGNQSATKLSRHAGAITLTLEPTPDLLAGVSKFKTASQIICAFAVEDGSQDRIEAKAKMEMQKKGADFSVVNTPSAMGADSSLACIMSSVGVELPWKTRSKTQLATEIVKLLENNQR